MGPPTPHIHAHRPTDEDISSAEVLPRHVHFITKTRHQTPAICLTGNDVPYARPSTPTESDSSWMSWLLITPSLDFFHDSSGVQLSSILPRISTNGETYTLQSSTASLRFPAQSPFMLQTTNPQNAASHKPEALHPSDNSLIHLPSRPCKPQMLCFLFLWIWPL